MFTAGYAWTLHVNDNVVFSTTISESVLTSDMSPDDMDTTGASERMTFTLHHHFSGPEVFVRLAVAMKFVDDDDNDD